MSGSLADGSGMPSIDDWMIGFYPHDWDGDELDFIVSADSGADLEATLGRGDRAARRR
jgi:hypothetical protein